jgi:hypothetical protein
MPTNRKIALAIYDIDESAKGPAYQMLHIHFSKHCWNRWGSPALMHVLPDILADGRIELTLTPSALRGQDVWKVGGKPELKVIQVRLPDDIGPWPSFGKTDAVGSIDEQGVMTVEFRPEPEQEADAGDSSDDEPASTTDPIAEGLPYGDDGLSTPTPSSKDPLWALVSIVKKLIAGQEANCEVMRDATNTAALRQIEHLSREARRQDEFMESRAQEMASRAEWEAQILHQNEQYIRHLTRIADSLDNLVLDGIALHIPKGDD